MPSSSSSTPAVIYTDRPANFHCIVASLKILHLTSRSHNCFSIYNMAIKEPSRRGWSSRLNDTCIVYVPRLHVRKALDHVAQPAKVTEIGSYCSSSGQLADSLWKCFRTTSDCGVVNGAECYEYCFLRSLATRLKVLGENSRFYMY